MSEFCIGCPKRGNVRGPFDEVITASKISYTVNAALGRGPLIDSHTGRVSAAVDKNYNVSEPIKIPPAVPQDREPEFMTRVVDGCSGPATHLEGIFKKREVVHACGSAMLRQLEIHPNIRQQLHVALQAEASAWRFIQ